MQASVEWLKKTPREVLTPKGEPSIVPPSPSSFCGYARGGGRKRGVLVGVARGDCGVLIVGYLKYM